MILDQKTYDSSTIRSKVFLRCDYCGKEFSRDKKSRIRLNKNVDKDSCGESACTEAKKREVHLINGYENPFSNPEVQKQIKKTNEDKYGKESYLSSNDFKDKRKKKLVERYGVESPLQSEAIKDKQRETCEELYGAKNVGQLPEFIEKRRANNNKKYGVDSPMQLEEFNNQRKETNRERYNFDNYTQTEEYRISRDQTCLERYGSKHPWGNKKIRAKSAATMKERYGETCYARTKEFQEKFQKTCMAKYGVPNPLLIAQTYGKAQNELGEWLNSFGFNFQKDHTILKGKEIDLYDANVGIGIEYCGLYWHTELSLSPRTKYYHYQKYKNCLDSKVRLITIFEDEWKQRNAQCQNMLKSMLGIHDRRVFARGCIVEPISKVEFATFCNAYHIQPANNLGFQFWGIKKDDELLGVLSLGRHPRKAEITLDRLCFKEGVQIVGGAGKLFAASVEWCKQNSIKQIVTWSDNRWSQGNVYGKIGFTLDKELAPDYAYVDLTRPYRRFSKQSQKKSNTGCPDGITEREFATERNFARIWDCGKKRWLFKIG